MKEKIQVCEPKKEEAKFFWQLAEETRINH